MQERSQVHESLTFSLVRDASIGTTGLQGRPPPALTRHAIMERWRESPNGAALHPFIKYFFPSYYIREINVRNERPTFYADCDGTPYMFRSARIPWLMECVDQFQTAHDILVGADLESQSIQDQCVGGSRGDHFPIIIGHHRQSATAPFLTSWHQRHQKRVDDFLNLPIMKRIIGLVTALVERAFPGVAARFRSEAKWHKDHYNIEPMFGLFWCFCLNAWFRSRGQRGIACDPHADSKNQIGVCVLLIYVLKGFFFNDDLWTWIVLWEAGLAVQLPAWTVAMYPSALFYHFNINVDKIQFVTTDGNVRPTPENSRPIVAGDDEGRGSMVFFNQATMSHGPLTGFNTLKEAKAFGVDVTVDAGENINDAFRRLGTFVTVAPPPSSPIS
ncbi:hypothetical protein C8F01DRAFT_599144 [Mycena amicta]|nr:hypothetical protein C8F01DRAFT_599144 [Mycena amicta]